MHFGSQICRSRAEHVSRQIKLPNVSSVHLRIGSPWWGLWSHDSCQIKSANALQAFKHKTTFDTSLFLKVRPVALLEVYIHIQSILSSLCFTFLLTWQNAISIETKHFAVICDKHSSVFRNTECLCLCTLLMPLRSQILAMYTFTNIFECKNYFKWCISAHYYKEKNKHCFCNHSSTRTI